MKKHTYRRGSVLMEFILVFPIYLVLFAGTIATGDRLIHSNRLIAADRISAFRVDGHVRDGFALSEWSGWDVVAERVFHPSRELDDYGRDQDTLTESREPHYADTTGPWSVCAVSTAHDAYRPLAGGVLGQLLAANQLVGASTVTNSGLLSSWVDMVSKDTANGASFYTLKRRDHYIQRLRKRTGDNKYIDPDALNWRDRTYVSRLLRTQNGPGTENWLLEVAGEGWHTAATVNGGSARTSCSEAAGKNISAYKRYSIFKELSQ